MIQSNIRKEGKLDSAIFFQIWNMIWVFSSLKSKQKLDSWIYTKTRPKPKSKCDDVIKEY